MTARRRYETQEEDEEGEDLSSAGSQTTRISANSSSSGYQTTGEGSTTSRSTARVAFQRKPLTVRELPAPRHNKLYRAPPTPELLERLEREKSFVLDCVAVGSISDEFARFNPKYGSALPPYNGQMDAHTRRYFQFAGVDQTLARNKQTAPGTSIDGAKQDWFNSAGHSFRYLSGRNLRQPNGYSNEIRMGHDCYWEHPNPGMIRFDDRRSRAALTTGGGLIGYNGRYGYRRTTPSLRQRPSTFGVNTTLSLY